MPKLQTPKSSWIPFFRGPFIFRRFCNAGKLLEGVTDQELVSWVARGENNHANIGRLEIDGERGCLTIRWQNPFQEQITLSPDSIGPGLLGNLANIGPRLANQLHVRNFLTAVISTWYRMKQEFQFAVEAGECRVFARVGSVLAPFTMIPPDVFRTLKIVSWGSENPGGSSAICPDGQLLYALWLEPSRFEKRSKTGRPAKYNWPAFHNEVRRKLEDEGKINPATDPSWNQARLEEHMLKWSGREWGEEPARSTIRRHVSTVLTERNTR